MTVPVFLCGALAHPPVLAMLPGEGRALRAAALPGHALAFAPGEALPQVVTGPGALEGWLADPSPGLAAIATVLGLEARPVQVLAGGANVAATLLAKPRPDAPGSRAATGLFATAAPLPRGKGGRPADAAFAGWTLQWAPMVTEVCAEVLRLSPRVASDVLARRLPQMLLAAAGRLRAAATPSPNAVRRPPGAVEVTALDLPYAGFFGVEEYRLRYASFNGGMSAEVLRSVFTSGDAVSVLPYDPARDRVLLVEQFRMGPLSRGDRNPWQLEAVAGRIDPGETPEEAGRREAVEEAGLTLGALLPVAEYYPTTGAMSEFLYSYVGLCDLPDGAAGVFGLEEEAEDIRGHVLDFDALMDLVASGEIANAPLLITALWLQRERPRLRKGG